MPRKPKSTITTHLIDPIIEIREHLDLLKKDIANIKHALSLEVIGKPKPSDASFTGFASKSIATEKPKGLI